MFEAGHVVYRQFISVPQRKKNIVNVTFPNCRFYGAVASNVSLQARPRFRILRLGFPLSIVRLKQTYRFKILSFWYVRRTQIRDSVRPENAGKLYTKNCNRLYG